MNEVTINKETFVKIIKALQEQKNREETFAEAIQNAFVVAGELPEFHASENFTPPTNVMIDQILEALSFGFVGTNQTQEDAYNHINYFFYELSLMDYVFMEPVSEDNRFEVHPVPAYYHSKDGTKLPLATPEDLYNSLVYEMTAKRPVESKDAQEDVDSIMNSAVFVEMYNRVVKIINDKLGLTENGTKIHVAPTNNICRDFGIYSAGSHACAEILMAINNEFGQKFSKDDFKEIETNPTPLAITKWFVSKIGLVSKS